MRKIVKTLLICMMVLLVAGCGAQKAPEAYEYKEENGQFVTQTEGMQVYIEEGSFETEEERDWAVYRLKEALQSAKSFLGEKNNGKSDIACRVHAGDGFTEITEEGLEVYYFGTVEQPYTNYMIQVLVGTEAPDYLREGLAAYGADQMKESLLNSYGAPLTALDSFRQTEKDEKAEEEGPYIGITELAKALHEAKVEPEAAKLGDLMAAISQAENGQAAGEYRGAYCIYAGSFVEYLAEEKGLDAVLSVYRGKNFEEVMGQPLEKVRQSWLQERLVE